MNQPKSNRAKWYRLAHLPLLLVACLLMLIGAAWARYRISQSQNVDYAAKDYAAICLWRDFDEETNTFEDGQNTWLSVDKQKTLHFCVSNGTAADHAADDQRVYIRLIADLGIQNGADMQISLDVLQTGKQYQGSVQPILEKTPLYKTIGPGWLITFRDDEGEELFWELEGGRLSVLSADLVARDLELEDTALLRLQVSGTAAAR